MPDQRKGGIAWCDETWNPTRGCSRQSPGCQHCYAERQAARFAGPGQPYHGLIEWRSTGEPRWSGVVRIVSERLEDPLRWQRPRRVFVNSMSDLFHEALSNEQIASVFAVMALAPQHTFQVLTKRAARMRDWFSWAAARAPEIMCDPVDSNVVLAFGPKTPIWERALERVEMSEAEPWPLPNVWLGVSCEDQQRLDERVPLLLDTPAAVRWVSAEPLLEAVTFRPRPRSDLCIRCGLGRDAPHDHPDGYRTHGLDWIVVGGESGPGARPCDVDWIRSVVHECRRADVPVFVKQLGSQPQAVVVSPKLVPERLATIGIWQEGWGEPGSAHSSTGTRQAKVLSRDGGAYTVAWPITDRKGDKVEDFPYDLRVREWPKAAA